MRPDTGECWSKTFSGEGREHELLEWLKKLPGPVRCAYESGCTGFWLSRFLGNEGIACEVMAVSTLPRLPKNKRHEDARVVVANIDVLVGAAVLDPAARAIVVALCMAVLSPVMAEIGKHLPEGE